MNDIVWRRGATNLLAFGRSVACSCDVRNMENGRRRRDEVVFSTLADGSRGKPYSPQLFPVVRRTAQGDRRLGAWTVGRPEPESHPYLAPYFIPTNAAQLVRVWSTEELDTLHYLAETDEAIEDWAYGLHCSTSPTTLGCITIADRDELMLLVTEINERLSAGKTVNLEVFA